MGSHTSKHGEHSDSHSTDATSAVSSEKDGVSRLVKTGTLQNEGVPIPVPPGTTKNEVLQKYDFTAVDKLAVEAPPELLLKTIRDVVEYLTVTPGGDVLDDISKVRALFRWVTSFDVYRIDTEVIPPEDSPLEYFMKIQCDLGDHAHMFYFLCQKASIPCVIINGMAKNGSYEIGGPLSRDAMASQWNAVYIQGEWRLIDAFWAVACAEAKTTTDYVLVDSDGKVTHVFENGVPEYPVNEFYFLCDPIHFIWTHLPDEEAWQLLTKPISSEEYENQIYVREQYCCLGMSIAEDYAIDSCTLKSNGETIKLAFNIPPDKSKNIKFQYALYQHRTQVETEKRVDILLERFVRLEHTNNKVRLKLRFPITGKLIFDLFGADMKSSGRFELICSYLLNVTKVTNNHMPFPDTPALGWGPNPYAEYAGLVLVEPKSTVLETHTGVCQVCVGLKEVKIINNVLKNTSMDDAVLSKHAVARFEEDTYIVYLRLPEEGEYALKIYAKTKQNVSDNFTELITFLIKFKGAIIKGQTNMPFPNVSGGLLGKKFGASKLKVNALTYKTNFVDLPEGEASFVFKCREDVKLLCEASSVLREASSRMGVKGKVENERYVFEVDFPVASEYSLNVFGIEDSDPNTLHEIHSYLVQSTGRPIKVHFMDDKEVEETISQGIKTSDGSIEIATSISEPMVGELLYSIIQRRDAKESVYDCKTSVTTSKARMIVNITDDGEYLMEVYETDEENGLLKIACFTISKNPSIKTYHNDINSLLKTLKPQRTCRKGYKLVKDITRIPTKVKKSDHSTESQTVTPRKKEQKRASDEKLLKSHSLRAEEEVITAGEVRVDREEKLKQDRQDKNEQGKGNDVNDNEDEKNIQVNSSKAVRTATSVTSVDKDQEKDEQKKQTIVKEGNSQMDDSQKMENDKQEESKLNNHHNVDERETEKRDDHQITVNNESREELTLSSPDDNNEKITIAGQVTSTAMSKKTGKRRKHTPRNSTNENLKNDKSKTKRNKTNKSMTAHEEVYSGSSSFKEIPTTGVIMETYSDNKDIKHTNIAKTENKVRTPRNEDIRNDNILKTATTCDAAQPEKLVKSKTNSNDKHSIEGSAEKIKNKRKNKPTASVVLGTTTNEKKKYRKKKQKDVTNIKLENQEEDDDQATSTDEENSLDGTHRSTTSVLTATDVFIKEKQKHKDHETGLYHSKTNHFSDDKNITNAKVNVVPDGKETKEKDKVEKSKGMTKEHNDATEPTYECENTGICKKRDSISKAETKSSVTHVRTNEKNELLDKEERNKITKAVPPLDLQNRSDDSNYSESEDEIFTDYEDEKEYRRQVTARKESVIRAIKDKNLKGLIRHLRELKSMENYKDEALVAEATTMIEVLKAKEGPSTFNGGSRSFPRKPPTRGLTAACNIRERAVLEKAIKKAKHINYKNALDVHIILASRVLKRLKRTEQLAKTVLEMNQKALVELKMYQTPPKGVHETLIATFLLLGEEMHNMKTWQSCKSILFKTGPQYIMRRISNFNPKTIAKETANSSKQLMAPLTLLQILDVSKGAASFYTWTKGMLEEIEEKKIVGPNTGQITVSRRQIPPRSTVPFYSTVHGGTIVMI